MAYNYVAPELSENDRNAVEAALNVHKAHSDELNKLNARLNELRNEFKLAVSNNNVEEIISNVEDSYDLQEYDELVAAAQNYGLGFHYEGYLWTPSTQSC